MFEMFYAILTDIPAALASLGLILATSSFISGLQLVRGTSATVEGRIHRFNGYSTITLFSIIVILSFARGGFSWLALLGWCFGAVIIMLKLLIVRVKTRRRRAFKYVSWLGGTLILMWFYIVYIHIPL